MGNEDFEDFSDLAILEDMMADYGIGPGDTIADLIEAIRESETEHVPED